MPAAVRAVLHKESLPVPRKQRYQAATRCVWGNMKLVADLFGYRARHNDRHRMVGGTAVHQENQKGNSELSAFRLR